MLSEPFIVERYRDHQFERRMPKAQLKKRQPDLCKHCMLGKHNPIHHAFPESTNRWAVHPHAYNENKKAWTQPFLGMLVACGVPKPLKRARVEGSFGFEVEPRTVDQENFRYGVSKFLADVMVEHDYIVDDGWSKRDSFWRFSFGEHQYEPDAGVQRLTLQIFVEI